MLSIRFVYDSNSATYKDIDIERMRLVEWEQPPENCPVCLLAVQRDQEEDPRKLSSGVAWHGINYHIHDFVMIKAEKGPCHIGHIVHIRFRTKSGPIVTVKLLGRISTLKTRPQNVTKDEVSQLYVANMSLLVQSHYHSVMFSSLMRNSRLNSKTSSDHVVLSTPIRSHTSEAGCLMHHSISTAATDFHRWRSLPGVNGNLYFQRIFYNVVSVYVRRLQNIGKMGNTLHRTNPFGKLSSTPNNPVPVFIYTLLLLMHQYI